MDLDCPQCGSRTWRLVEYTGGDWLIVRCEHDHYATVPVVKEGPEEILFDARLYPGPAHDEPVKAAHDEPVKPANHEPQRVNPYALGYLCWECGDNPARFVPPYHGYLCHKCERRIRP
jgi:hypothetical protein